MGSLFSLHKRSRGSTRASSSASSRSSAERTTASHPSMSSSRQDSIADKKISVKQKYGFIPDTFSSLEEVTAALRNAGLESCNLIVGIDFTKSNEWTGKVSFNNRSLHAIGDTPNPYEKAISIIGKTLAPLDEDNLIPCFGFGDATTHDDEVFSFHSDHLPCHGFEEVLSCYRKIVPNLRLSGPTSYAPVVEAAVDIVEKSGGQYHVLLIIADGQVTRSVNTSDAELSPQEAKTINSIVNARFCLGSMLSQGGLTAIENFPEKFSLEWCGANVIKVTEKVARAAVCDSKNGGLGLRRHADLNYASVIRHI